MSGSVCTIDNCGQVRYARGWCQKHYKRWRAHGNPMTTLREPTPEMDQDRFWSKVEKTAPDGCWLWLAGKNASGYGKFVVGGAYGQHWLAHRYAYTSLRGQIEVGMELDHLCRIRACVNPAHLEQVTRAENARRRWVA